MSKIKELFGVEIGEAFNIESKDYGTMENCFFGSIGMLHAPDTTDFIKLTLMGELLTGEAKIVKPILTDGEREYLMAVCNPNFMAGTIIGYFRHPNRDGKYFVEIITTCTNHDCRIYCTSDKSFEGMNEHEIYTPKELGLEKEEK